MVIFTFLRVVFMLLETDMTVPRRTVPMLVREIERSESLR